LRAARRVWGLSPPADRAFGAEEGISELMEDEDESVEREVRKWVKQIEKVLGERLDDFLDRLSVDYL
jgi:hypothetical protein